jgi:hypothetical protein
VSYDVDLFVNGDFTAEQLAAALQPHFDRPFERAVERDGTDYWGFTYEGCFTCVGSNSLEDDDYDPVRHPLVVTFFRVEFDTDAERDAWIDRTWARWLPWLREAGAKEVLLVPNVGPVRHRWPPLVEGQEAVRPPRKEVSWG